MYYNQDTIHSATSGYTPPEPQKTVFDGLPGQPTYRHYDLCCRIQDMLDIYQETYALHIEVELVGPSQLFFGLDPGYLDYVRDIVASRIEHAFGQEQADITSIQCRTIRSRYAPGKGQLHLLLLINQDAYYWLGNSDQESRDVLTEFISDAWQALQTLEHYHPSWIQSRHRTTDDFYLTNSPACKGVQGVSALLAV